MQSNREAMALVSILEVASSQYKSGNHISVSEMKDKLRARAKENEVMPMDEHDDL